MLSAAPRSESDSKAREHMSKLIDHTGQRFGRLTVLRLIGVDSRRNARWLCVCDCGAEVRVSGALLRTGHTSSCGCFRREATARKFRIHGKALQGAPSGSYRSWAAMKTRCTNSKQGSYPNYGGRGITVCDQWLHSFENFFADMGERPPGMTLDRFPDNDGPYCKENCRWATRAQQRMNQRPRRGATLSPAY